MGFKKIVGKIVKPVASLLGVGGGGGGDYGYYGYYGEGAPIRRGDAPLAVAGALTSEQGAEALRNNMLLLNSRYTPEERSLNALAGRYAPGQRSAYDTWMRNYQSNGRVNALMSTPGLTSRPAYTSLMDMASQGQTKPSHSLYGQYNFNDPQNMAPQGQTKPSHNLYD